MLKPGMKISMSVLLCFMAAFSFAQTETYPSIVPPLHIPITLSGTYCELRNTHFHGGIDIRTDGREGLNVYAVEEGYVSRIRVSGNGYGNALYIDHPNGYTSVYGHLQKFSPQLAAWVRAVQFHLESFDIDTLPPKNLLTVKRDEVVAISGNTGASQSPHLHFEMRETVTEAPVNPLLFGIKMKDNIAPAPTYMAFYALHNHKVETAPVKQRLINKGSSLGFENDTVKLNTTLAGFSVYAIDRMEDSDNNNGIYELTMQVNGKRAFHFSMNRLSRFEDVRYILAHMDYRMNKTNGVRYHRCYKLPGNYAPLYDNSVDGNGTVALDHGEVKKIDITMCDFNRNTTHISFYVKGDSTTYFFKYGPKLFEKILSYQEPVAFHKEELYLEFPDSIFYDDIYFTYSKNEPLNIAKTFSSVHQVHTDLDPCHREFKISVQAKNFPQYAKDKALLARENFKGSRYAHMGKWEEDFFTSSSKEFGKFYISMDTTPPVISPVNIYANKLMSSVSRVRFKISDNFSGIHSFDMYIDGKWVLAEYDAKSNYVWHDFDKQLEQGVHDIVFEVRDYLNNIATYKTKFRK